LIFDETPDGLAHRGVEMAHRARFPAEQDLTTVTPGTPNRLAGELLLRGAQRESPQGALDQAHLPQRLTLDRLDGLKFSQGRREMPANASHRFTIEISHRRSQTPNVLGEPLLGVRLHPPTGECETLPTDAPRLTAGDIPLLNGDLLFSRRERPTLSNGARLRLDPPGSILGVFLGSLRLLTVELSGFLGQSFRLSVHIGNCQ
jgi:hypothetical protein